MEIDEHIGCAMSGLIADARTLVEHARVETQVPFVIMLMILMYICFTFFLFFKADVIFYFALWCRNTDF